MVLVVLGISDAHPARGKGGGCRVGAKHPLGMLIPFRISDAHPARGKGGGVAEWTSGTI